MSPTEHDLRAALRDGEGDGPDPFVVTAAGRRAAARRRSQLVNTAAAVVLIGGLGTAGTLLLPGSDNEHASGSKDFGAAAKAPNALHTQNAAGGASGGGANTDSSRGAAGGTPVVPPDVAAPANSCPATAPAIPAPARGTGSSGPLFRQTPAELVVCTYAGAPSSAGPAELVLTGADAGAVLSSLDAAAPEPPTGMCPHYRLAGERTVEIIGRSAAGTPVGSVIATLDRPACATVVTNGTVVRYGWAPPAQLLEKVGPIGGRSHGPVAQTTSPSR